VNVGNSTSAVLNNLAGSTTYYWQVHALNGIGSTEANAGSWWNFKTTICYSLSTGVNPSGAGSIGIGIAPNCAGGLYDSGSVVQLTANASSGYSFSSWSGSATGTSNPLSLTMSVGTRR